MFCTEFPLRKKKLIKTKILLPTLAQARLLTKMMADGESAAHGGEATAAAALGSQKVVYKVVLTGGELRR